MSAENETDEAEQNDQDDGFEDRDSVQGEDHSEENLGTGARDTFNPESVEPAGTREEEGDESDESAEDLEFGGDPESAGEEEDTAIDKMGERAEPLLDSDTVRSPIGPLPTGGLKAIGVFLVVFLVVFFGLWALLGGLGLFLGIVLGAGLGFLAVKQLAEREA